MLKTRQKQRRLLEAFGLLVAAALCLGSTAHQLALLTVPDVPISDFGRDLVAARAAAEGRNPYSYVARLDPSVQGVPGDWMVGHSPLSVVLAHPAVNSPDLGSAESKARLVTLLGVWLLGLGLAVMAHRSGWPYPASASVMLLVPATTFAVEDVRWVQGVALAGVLMVLVLGLRERGKTRVGAVLMGTMVAWRPWMAPIALMLPRSHSLRADAGIALGTAVVATAVALQSLGGLPSLEKWIAEVLPDVLTQWRQWRGNGSLTSALPSLGLASAVYIAAILTMIGARFRLSDDLWPLVASVLVLAASPLVWGHYVLGLYPGIIWTLLKRGQSYSRVGIFVILGVVAIPGGIESLAQGSAASESIIAVGIVGTSLVLLRIATGKRPLFGQHNEAGHRLRDASTNQSFVTGGKSHKGAS